MQSAFHIRWKLLDVSTVLRLVVHFCLLLQFHLLHSRQGGCFRRCETTVVLFVHVWQTLGRAVVCTDHSHILTSHLTAGRAASERMQSLPTQRAAGRVSPHLPPFSSLRWNMPQQQTLWSTLPATRLCYLCPPLPAPTAATNTHNHN